MKESLIGGPALSQEVFNINEIRKAMGCHDK